MSQKYSIWKWLDTINIQPKLKEEKISKIRRIGPNFDLRKSKTFALLLLRSSKIKVKDYFNLIDFGTWIGQDDRISSKVGNGFSQGSKPRGAIIFILFTLRVNCPFI